MISKELLDILACPQCKGDLDYDTENSKLICKTCRMRFPILDNDIPNMLVEDAEKY